MVYADLHIHTLASDGSMAPKTVLEQAKKIGLKALSFTDHENIMAYCQTYEYACKLDLHLLPGIEMVTSYLSREVHLLGYNFNPNSDILISRLKTICQERNTIGQQVIRQLQNYGFNISWEQAEPLIPPNGILGKNHILQVLRQAGYIQNQEQTIAFLRQYLNTGGLAHIPYEGNPLSAAVSLIHAAGGIAVLAHPGLLKDNEVIAPIIEEGIDALEVFYYYLGNNRQAYIRYFYNLAQKHRLLITGGTDFHGGYTPVKMGSMGISITHLEKLKNSKHQHCQLIPLKGVLNLT